MPPRRGMSLVEALIALAIMSFFTAFILSVYTDGQRKFIEGGLRSDIWEMARSLMSWISQDANAASRVDPKWHPIRTSASTLVLELPCLDESGLMIDDINQRDAVIFSVANGVLTRRCEPHARSTRPESRRVLATNVVALTFAYYDTQGVVLTANFDQAASVKASATISVRTAGRTFNQTLDTTFTLRNRTPGG